MATFIRDKSSGIIYIYHYENGEQWRASTRVKLDKSKWDSAKQKPVSSKLTDDKGVKVTERLDQCKGWLALALKDLEKDGEKLEVLTKYYNNRRLGKQNVKEEKARFMPYFETFQEQKKQLGASTWKEYRTTFKILKEYFGNKNPTFDEIDLDFYVKFNIWIKDREISNSTLSSHWKRIKTVMGEAYDRGLHANASFRRFKRVEEVSDSIALTDLELDKIEYAVLPQRLDIVRDYFVAACFCGMRYSDYGKIRASNIKDGFLTYRSQKTDLICHIPVHWKLRLIINKYNGILPELISNQKFDKYIKEVCEISGIDEFQQTRITKGGVKRVSNKRRSQLVTSHTARRTFATRLVLKAIPVHLIMLMTGHKSLDSFDKYVRLRELQSKTELSRLAFFTDLPVAVRMPKVDSPDDWF